MPSSRLLKRRIKSVSNISQITKAMEMVSASKMRQAQLQALSSRQYSRKLDEVLTNIAANLRAFSHPLLNKNFNSQKQALIILSTDRGLTGSLNTNLFKAVTHFQADKQIEVFTLGKLAKKFAIKSGLNLIADFGSIPEKITYDQAVPIANHVIKEFLKGSYQTVWLSYMDFVSTLSQLPRITQLLPIQKDLEEPTKPPMSTKEYLFEPNATEILNWILPYFVELTIYQSLLEARASEHSARMVAMKNASENAGDLVDNLQLVYNRSRQASITSELLDIVTASATLTA